MYDTKVTFKLYSNDSIQSMSDKIEYVLIAFYPDKKFNFNKFYVYIDEYFSVSFLLEISSSRSFRNSTIVPFSEFYPKYRSIIICVKENIL